jgi:hypothetical protein
MNNDVVLPTGLGVEFEEIYLSEATSHDVILVLISDCAVRSSGTVAVSVMRAGGGCDTL